MRISFTVIRISTTSNCSRKVRRGFSVGTPGARATNVVPMEDLFESISKTSLVLYRSFSNYYSTNNFLKS